MGCLIKVLIVLLYPNNNYTPEHLMDQCGCLATNDPQQFTQPLVLCVAVISKTNKDRALGGSGEMKQLDWLEKVGKELRIHTKDIKEKRQWVEGLMSKIVVKPVWAKKRQPSWSLF